VHANAEGDEDVEEDGPGCRTWSGWIHSAGPLFGDVEFLGQTPLAPGIRDRPPKPLVTTKAMGDPRS
jgi:hypothetical protein